MKREIRKAGKISRFMAILLLCISVFSGCGKAGASLQEEEKSGGQKTPVLQEEIQDKEKEEEKEDKEELSEETEENIQAESERSCMLQEDETALYICSTYRLLKIDKQSKEAEILWENKKDGKTRKNYLYSAGSGLLIKDRLYFFEAWEEGMDEKMALSVIGTDGSGYQRLKQMEKPGVPCMALTDGILTVDNRDSSFQSQPLCFRMNEDGTLSELAEADIEIPDGYEAPYYGNQSVLFAEVSEKDLGYQLLRNENYDLVKRDRETGKEEKMPAELVSPFCYNEKYFVSLHNDSLYRIDRESFQAKRLAEAEGYPDLAGIDKDYVYLMHQGKDENGKSAAIYERVSLATGEKEELFKQEGERNYLLSYPSVKNGYLYYQGRNNYKYYLMRRNLSAPFEEERLGEAFYDTGIGEVGKVLSYYEEIYSEAMPDVLLMTVEADWLQVDGRFAGADKINGYLEAEKDKDISYGKERAAEMADWMEDLAEMGISGSYSSGLSEISYFDGRFLSFCQEGYDYAGGAHGMPFRIGHTFDLTSGEMLSLATILENSEAELKDIVTGYFEKYISENQEMFWDDALDTVRESVTFESDFYFTEEGIAFYFEPYLLASYAGGFQEVVIPYEEFALKIPMKSNID